MYLAALLFQRKRIAPRRNVRAWTQNLFSAEYPPPENDHLFPSLSLSCKQAPDTSLHSGAELLLKVILYTP
jgi:hypothetical protein